MPEGLGQPAREVSGVVALAGNRQQERVGLSRGLFEPERLPAAALADEGEGAAAVGACPGDEGGDLRVDLHARIWRRDEIEGELAIGG